MVPVLTNVASSNCPKPISSNCVTFVGTNPPGLCGPQSLTAVITTLQTTVANSSSCCTGTFPPGNSSGYTGNWVDFSAGIPLTGIGTTYNWTISNFGTSFNGTPAGTITGLENTPSYYWTQQGDLKVRGSMTISINSTKAQQIGIAAIPLVSLNTANFPTNFTAAQSHFIGTAASAQAPGQSIQAFVEQVTRAFLTIDFPSGILYLNYVFVNTVGTNVTENLFFGGTIFNLA